MRDDKLIEAMRESFEAWFSDDWQHPSAVERDAVGYKLAQAQNAWTAWQAAWQAALAALQETHAVVPREPVAWRRPSISGRHRWIFAYAREAAHFNQGEWEPLYAAAPAPQPEEAL